MFLSVFARSGVQKSKSEKFWVPIFFFYICFGVMYIFLQIQKPNIPLEHHQTWNILIFLKGCCLCLEVLLLLHSTMLKFNLILLEYLIHNFFWVGLILHTFNLIHSVPKEFLFDISVWKNLKEADTNDPSVLTCWTIDTLPIILMKVKKKRVLSSWNDTNQTWKSPDLFCAWILYKCFLNSELLWDFERQQWIFKRPWSLLLIAVVGSEFIWNLKITWVTQLFVDPKKPNHSFWRI